MTGAILLVIVVAWAAVLVPVWVRRHDVGDETRTVDRFNSAMHVLSRRPERRSTRRAERRRSARYAIVPRRRPEAVMPVLSGSGIMMRLSRRRPVPPRPDVDAPVALTPPVGRVASAARREALIRRRQRTLLTLVGVFVAVAALAALGLLPLWSAAVALLLPGAYLVHLRRQTVASLQAQRALRRHPAPAGATPVAPPREESVAQPAVSRPASPAPAYAGAAHRAPERRVRTLAGFTWSRSAAAVAPGHAAATAPPAEEVAAVSEPAPVAATAGGSYGRPWQPVPIPRPTYVDAPIAPRPARRIFDEVADEMDDDGDDVVIRRVVGG